jgi:hypothetical protein
MSSGENCGAVPKLGLWRVMETGIAAPDFGFLKKAWVNYSSPYFSALHLSVG